MTVEHIPLIFVIQRYMSRFNEPSSDYTWRELKTISTLAVGIIIYRDLTGWQVFIKIYRMFGIIYS